MTVKLKARLRQEVNKGVNKLRNSGFVPGVVYGRGIANLNISVGGMELAKIIKESGENTLLELEVDGIKPKNVLIHDTQVDPVKGEIQHADFLEVRMDQKIKTHIPLIFIGEAAAVKGLGGVLVRNTQEVEIEALPKDLPHNIEVDVTALDTFEKHIKVSDLKIPSGVKIIAEAHLIVASVVPPRSEAELEELKGEVVEDVSKVEGVVKPEKVDEVEKKIEDKK